MLWLKGCLRCGGDLRENTDEYGYYVRCLQCGYYLTDARVTMLLLSEKPLARPLRAQPEKIVAAA